MLKLIIAFILFAFVNTETLKNLWKPINNEVPCKVNCDLQIYTCYRQMKFVMFFNFYFNFHFIISQKYGTLCAASSIDVNTPISVMPKQACPSCPSCRQCENVYPPQTCPEVTCEPCKPCPGKVVCGPCPSMCPACPVIEPTTCPPQRAVQTVTCPPQRCPEQITCPPQRSVEAVTCPPQRRIRRGF